MLDGAELLISGPMSRKGAAMLRAMEATAPAGSKVTQSYRGRHRLLLVYGVGEPLRYRARREHLARGGHVAMLDLGYWDREHQANRISVDHLHPAAAQLALAPEGDTRSRPRARAERTDGGDAVLLVGMGPKSVHMYGLQPHAWERKKLAEIKARFPGREIIWRPKGRDRTVLIGATTAAGGSVLDILPRCGLVVCRHSNVAIDACVAGVPVECDDGAAAALYANCAAPSLAERDEFLRRLSWWNWRPSEAAQAWQWIATVTAQ